MARVIDEQGKLGAPQVTLTKEERDEYFRLLELHNQNRIDYNVRKWETVKFGQTFSGVLFAAAIAAYLSAVQWTLFDKDPAVKWYIASLFGGAAIGLIITYQNLSRESARLFEEEGSMFKIAKFLDLDVELPKNLRWVPDDKNLLFIKWQNHEYKIVESLSEDAFSAWVRQRTEGHEFFKGYGILFCLIGLTAIALAVVTLYRH